MGCHQTNSLDKGSIWLILPVYQQLHSRLFTCEKQNETKFKARALASSTMSPKVLKQLESELRAFMIVSESPSNSTSSTPSSRAKEIAFLQAIASTSSIAERRLILSESAPMN
ncbi:hypothetical protein SO802_010717 [Lithocarpus litseifolius]|uniref:Uncharacterized protein n=1 Tax=Lithocarpus litseifolius TaxID=425828 RepID=A0AAW2DIS9_9ROSI